MIVELAVEAEGDPVALELAIANEGRRAARDLYRSVLADADRRAVDASLPGGLAGKWLTATTDSAGNTSEFSQAIEVRAAKK